MAYNIVKHRRGTTQEWLEVDLVPENGELVIEECADGTRKCKIGNGIYSFSKLPYTDDATQAKLLEEIDKLRLTLSSELAKTRSDLSSGITESKTEILGVVEKNKAELTSMISDGNAKIAAEAKNNLEQTTSDLHSAIQTELAVVDSRIDTVAYENALKTQKALSNLNDRIDEVANKSATDLQDAVDTISDRLSQQISNESTVRSNQVKALEKNIAEVAETIEEHIHPTIQKIDTKHTQAIEQLETKHTTTVEQLSTDLEQKAATLAEQITSCETAFNKTISNTVTELTSGYETKLASTEKALQEAVDNVDKKHTTDVQELQKAIDTTLSEKENTILASLDGLRTELVNANEELTNIVTTLEEQGQTAAADLLSRVDTLHKTIERLAEKDAEVLGEIALVRAELQQGDSAITTNLEAVSARHIADHVKILSELSRIEEAQRLSDSNITEATLEALAKVYTELADLVEDDILILRKVFSVEVTLRDSIENMDTKLSEDIDIFKSEVSNSFTNLETTTTKAVDDLTSRLTSDLETLRSALMVSIEDLRSTTNIKFRENTKAVEELSETVQALDASTTAKFTEVDQLVKQGKDEAISAAAAVGEQLSAVNSRIDLTNKAIDAQTKRISNIIAIAPGSTTGDVELMDIRNGYNGLTHETAGDAVRAIGNELESLKNSLPDYIPDNAVDGLIYDTETSELYLASNNEPVGDPVVIVSGGGGGGGGSASSVKVQNNLPATSFTIAKGNPANIKFTYTSFENEVPTGDGTFIVTINNKRIDKLSGTIQHGVAKELEVSEYLKNGTNNVKVTCTDQYGTSRSLVYNISQIELRIESTFDSTRIFNDTVQFRYKIFGQIEKTAHVLLDGVDIANKKFSASVSGSETTLLIPKQAHGSHTIKAYITAEVDGIDISSNILEFEIICIEAENNTACLASTNTIKEVSQGDLVTIPFMLYDPVTLTGQVDLTIYSLAGGRVEYHTTSIIADRSQQLWQTRNYPTGTAIFKISYTYDLYGTSTTIEKEHTITVKPLELDIEPETDGLQLYLAAQGRSNSEQNPAVWTYQRPANGSTKYDLVTTQFSNFNWKSNGWCVDDSGDTCLRLNGDAKAVINFKPFKEDFKQNGKTIEFEFVVRDVNNREAIVIDCFDGVRGFRATPDTAFLKSSGTEVTCRYKDEERVRVAIAVEYADSTSRFVSIYLDGILSGVQRYATTDNFAQDNPLNITIGSSLCGIDLYAIRIYDKALSTKQVLTNYIADKAEPTTKLKLMTDNDILDENGNVSYDRLKALGQIPIITFTGQMPTYKGDKKKKSVRMKFEDPLHPEMNFDVLLDQIDVQGTSSQFYIRKNWKVKLPEARPHMPGAIPAKVYCIKVDYAEATGTHNTGIANYVETLYDRNEVTLPPQKDDTRVRTTIQGFPIVIFEKADEDAEPVFSSKGNFNYDKDAENAFGFTEDYKNFGVECWEFCNNTSDPVNFVGEIPDEWLEDFEPRYVPESADFERIEELQEIAELAASGKGMMTDAQRNELATLMRNCMANFKAMHDWVLSTATYKLVDGKKVAITPVALETPVTYGETTYTEDNEEYRLAKFKYEFEDHFNMHYSSMYYVFTLFALMTDQRAKNLFLTRWKDDDGVYRWYPYFYDNDTIFGINNEGALVFDYFHEDIDQLGSSNVFNGQNSVLWHNFRLCFPKQIEDTYSELRSNGKLTYNKIIDQFVTKGSDSWSAAIYNADADYKYVSMAREAIEHKDEDGNTVTGIDASNLYQVRGPGEHHLRYFIANRLKYCDSKWYAGSYPSDDIFLRIYTPKPADDATPEEIARINNSLKVVPANPNITLTPFSDMYAGVRYKSGTLQQQRLKAGESYTFSPLNANETFGDTETAIYGAGELSSLGDLSGLYCGVINLSNAAKLTELTVGNKNPAYYNDNFREISVGSNRLLRYIDLRNCSGLGIAGENPQKTLELSGCPNIEHIYAEGTNLASVDLPDGGYIKTLHLPASINTLVVKNHKHITDFSIESCANIRTLCIENSNIDSDSLLNACSLGDGKYSVERVRLTGINWSFDDTSFVKSLFPRFDDDGNVIGGIRGIDEKNNNLDDAYLAGTCYIKSLSGADYAEIKAHYPYLDIKFGTMTSNVYFVYEVDGVETTHTVELTSTNSKLGTCPAPVLNPAPNWPENDAFYYVQSGWSRKKQVTKGIQDSEEDYLAFVQADALLNIAGDRTLYPIFKAVRKSYTVKFINSTLKTDQVLQEIEVLYGHDGAYDGMIPTKQDAASPELYAFTSWHPKPENITGHLECYAQFTILDDKWYTIGISDISDCVDRNGNIYNGYTLNQADKTISIDTCNNKYNQAVKVPETIDVLRETFSPNVELTIAVEDGAYDSISFDYKFTSDGELSFGLYNVDMSKGFGPFLMRADAPCEDYSGIEVEQLPNGYCRATVHLAEVGITNNEANRDNVPDTVASFVILGAATSATGYIDRIIAKNASVELESLVNSYTVTSVGGFTEHNGLELINLPNTTTDIKSRGFYNCYSMFEVDIPKSVKTIGSNAFQNCSRLKKIVIPAGVESIGQAAFADCRLDEISVEEGNRRYYIDENCLIDRDNSMLMLGLSSGTIPSYITRLGDHCFSNTNITTANIPEGITTVSNNAFSRCEKLYSVTLPKTVTILDATCFAWCPELYFIQLPPNLTEIRTYVFDSCPLSDVLIPETVHTVLQRAFGDIPSLRSVTFNSKTAPYMHEEVFINSGCGTEESPMVIKAPWDYDNTSAAPWGAVGWVRVEFGNATKIYKDGVLVDA